MEERYNKLREKMDELLKWKADNERQQVIFPMGPRTTKIVHQDLLVITGKTATGVTFNKSLEVFFESKLGWLPAKLQL